MKPTASEASEREFEYRREDFDAIRQLVRDSTGIHLSDSKHELVYSRLSRPSSVSRITSTICATTSCAR
jgi:chemotaxis protein methyltransferase CheR